MKAVQINGYGGVEVLEFNQNAPKSLPSENQVLIEVQAVSINPFDYKVREGYMKDAMPLSFPATVGGDFSGIVLETGSGVTEFKSGDKVYGSALIFNGGSGSFAEFCVARKGNIALKPTTVDFAYAGALPLVGSSAIQAIEDHIKLQKNQKILIHGGAGGIGHMAIQLAKAIGAYVATTVSRNDMGFVKELGADEVIDYKTQKFEDILKDYDAVFDTTSKDSINRSFQILKKGGILVCMGGDPDENLAKKYGVTLIRQGTKPNTEHLRRLSQLVDSGKIKVAVDKIYPLEEVKEAFTYQEQVHPRGKVVLKIK